MDTTKLKPEIQRAMLRDLCVQISQLDEQYLTDDFVEILLGDMVSNLEEASQDDHFGTEGWEHFFGYDE